MKVGFLLCLVLLLVVWTDLNTFVNAKHRRRGIDIWNNANLVDTEGGSGDGETPCQQNVILITKLLRIIKKLRAAENNSHGSSSSSSRGSSSGSSSNSKGDRSSGKKSGKKSGNNSGKKGIGKKSDKKGGKSSSKQSDKKSSGSTK